METIKIRLRSYKAVRQNYGSRTFIPKVHECSATLLEEQNKWNVLVQLTEDCAGYKKGHKISIDKQDLL